MTAALLHHILSPRMECCRCSQVRWKQAGGGRGEEEVAVAFLPLMHISALFSFFFPPTGEPCIGGGGGGGELDRKRLEDFLPPLQIFLRPFPFSPPLAFPTSNSTFKRRRRRSFCKVSRSKRRQRPEQPARIYLLFMATLPPHFHPNPTLYSPLLTQPSPPLPFPD